MLLEGYEGVVDVFGGDAVVGDHSHYGVASVYEDASLFEVGGYCGAAAGWNVEVDDVGVDAVGVYADAVDFG